MVKLEDEARITPRLQVGTAAITGTLIVRYVIARRVKKGDTRNDRRGSAWRLDSPDFHFRASER